MLLRLPFPGGALKGHFGKVRLYAPSLNTVVKLVCLQQVTEIECDGIQECEVSFSVRYCDVSCLDTDISAWLPSAFNLGKYPLIHPYKCGIYYYI